MKPICLVALAFLPACGVREPTSLPTGGSANVIETPLSDAEISRRGVRPIYRFRSVPDLVLVDKDTPDLGRPVNNSLRLAGLNDRHNRREFMATLSAPSSLSTIPIEEKQTYWEAHFAEAAALAPQLNPVPIALIDSGVVAITPRLRAALRKESNFTTDKNECSWNSHATAIANLMVGSDTPNHPCVDKNIPTSTEFSMPLASHARIHSVKISFDSDELSSLNPDLGMMQLAVAIDDAVANGAKLINLSFSYSHAEPPANVRAVESMVIAAAAERNVLFVIAAGNGSKDTGQEENFPMAYGFANMIAVGSHNIKLEHAYSSNFGWGVDLSAQGVEVLSRSVNGEEKNFSGTSFAAPVVTSALSYYYALRPNTDYRSVLRALYQSSTPSYNAESLNLRVSRFGRLNVEDLVKRALQTAP